MELFIRQLINGLNTGSIYALVAIGYTMVYGIIKLINFAHGEIMMFGAYFAFLLAFTLSFNLPFLLVIVLSMSFAAILGVLIERVAYKKLRQAPRISALITAIGMSLFLQHLAQLIFGSTPYVMKPLIDTTPVVLFNFAIPKLTLLTIGLSILFMLLLSFFVLKTKPGKAMRAVSQDKEAAILMGINVDNVISMTFAIGSALGALGGIFYAMTYSQIYPTMGVLPGLKAFIAAVFGGIGSIGGAMLGGYLIGIIETMTKAYISSKWVDVIVFGLLIVILLFKPSGILGKNTKEKV
ncbi:MAG: branched-chain amino acid ABC transporter permease [Candidatus Izimaplasma sp.]|nr:branched-chain amino acid ABC transporter permease [Candidatus Izimaplasma bacterium]